MANLIALCAISLYLLFLVRMTGLLFESVLGVHRLCSKCTRWSGMEVLTSSNCRLRWLRLGRLPVWNMHRRLCGGRLKAKKLVRDTGTFLSSPPSESMEGSM